MYIYIINTLAKTTNHARKHHKASTAAIMAKLSSLATTTICNNLVAFKMESIKKCFLCAFVVTAALRNGQDTKVNIRKCNI